MKELEELVKRNDIRTADRANMRRMLRQLRQGRALTYQERQNLAAYLSRYRDLLAHL